MTTTGRGQKSVVQCKTTASAYLVLLLLFIVAFRSRAARLMWLELFFLSFAPSWVRYHRRAMRDPRHLIQPRQFVLCLVLQDIKIS